MNPEIIQIAEKLAAQRLVVQNMGMMNAPSDVKERIEFDALYMLAVSKLRHLNTQYEAALSKYYGEDHE
jgi:hypothetical protein